MLNMFLILSGVPRCQRIRCDGIIKPDIILYGDNLDEEVVSKAVDYISKADLLIVGGTSLTVFPASNLINYFRGDNLVIINKETTNIDFTADLLIHEPLGEVFKEI